MTVDDITTAVIWVSTFGVFFRAAFCVFRMISADEEREMYKKRLKHVIVFYVIVVSLWHMRDIAFNYFG